MQPDSPFVEIKRDHRIEESNPATLNGLSQTPVTSTNNSMGELLFPTSASPVQKPLELSGNQRHELWNIFTENVDLLIKILHKPTAEPLFDSEPSTPETSALVAAICLSATTSLTDHQCQSRLGHPKELLTAHFKSATESALSRASFLTTASLQVHQAFVIYLNSVATQNIVNLNCALVRLALNLARFHGFHRDGSSVGLSPFETEMRRRLWWSLVCIDFRYSEESDFATVFAVYLEDIQLPLNINDDDIDPTMTELPQPRKCVTEMTLSLVRMELSLTWRQIRLSWVVQSYSQPAPPSLLDRHIDLIDDCEARILKTYLQDMAEDTSEQPIPKVLQQTHIIMEASSLLLQVVSSKMRILAATATASESAYQDSGQGGDLETSIRILEVHKLLCKNDVIAHWSWFFKSYPPWRAMIRVLRHLCHEQPDGRTRRAWQAIDSLYDAKIPQDIVLAGDQLAETAMKLKEQALARRIRQSLGPG